MTTTNAKKFTYAGVTYVSQNWNEGYVRLPDGKYLFAEFVNGEPQNITQRKLMVAPANCAVATILHP